ncbi:MAG: MBL fold metallo-hydrolase, partial [Oscillospiraceae bacterium]|nr:MBL fold metallo-hydrolase [Oscillospiraceae bacterium]
YSGSSGNCTLIRDSGTALLIDMGKSCKATLSALYTAGVSAKDISGILVTHEHSDHIAGLGIFLKYYPVPLFGPEAVLEYLFDAGLIPDCDLIEVEPGVEVMLGGLTFTPFRTSHDSLDCFGYRFLFENGRSAAIATDLGCMQADVMEQLSGCAFVGLESNYDRFMLRVGRYPPYLKRRIASDRGHLSNDDCAVAFAELALRGTEKFTLMHLSEENNAPDIALTACLGALENNGRECPVEVAPRHGVGMAIEV